MPVHRRRADPGPLRDLNVGRGDHALLAVQRRGGLDDALAGGVEALGPLPHPVLSARHVDSPIDERIIS